jgi:hypothetical protein
MRLLRGLGRFWYDFVIGDDWKIAAAVLAALTVAGVLAVAGVPAGVLAPLAAGLVAVAFLTALAVDTQTRRSANHTQLPSTTPDNSNTHRMSPPTA